MPNSPPTTTADNPPPVANYYTSIYDTVASLCYAALNLIKRLPKHAYYALLHPYDAHAYYKHLMQVASNYDQWASAAEILDRLQGKGEWKLDPKSADYDYGLISSRLQALKKAREDGELAPMIFLLRTSLFRNLGNMGKPTLFTYTNIGTKKLIEEYIEEVVKQLHLICDTDSPDLSIKKKLEFFMNTRQSFGRTALLLSGGATLGMNHIGVVKCLYECKLLPRIISGTSSGSIIAAIVCSKTDDEFTRFFRPEAINLNFFHLEGEPDSVLIKLLRLIRHGALFDVEVLKECVRSNIGDVTFQEAYNRTRRILNISVSSSGIFEMPRLLNYITAPNVIIWSAVAASCAVPMVYNAAPLVAKDKGNIVPWNPSGHRWIDGSVESDLPMVRLAEIFNVNHFIVSQVNPHIIPFLHKGIVRSRMRRLVGKVLELGRRFVQHYIKYGIEFDVCPNVLHRVHQLLSQKYYGDITIVPTVGIKEYLRIVDNPTRQLFLESSLRGERATWPKTSLIQNHLQIELAIDEVLYRLRTKLFGKKNSLHFSDSDTPATGLGPPSPCTSSHSCLHLQSNIAESSDSLCSSSSSSSPLLTVSSSSARKRRKASNELWHKSRDRDLRRVSCPETLWSPCPQLPLKEADGANDDSVKNEVVSKTKEVGRGNGEFGLRPGSSDSKRRRKLSMSGLENEDRERGAVQVFGPLLRANSDSDMRNEIGRT